MIRPRSLVEVPLIQGGTFHIPYEQGMAEEVYRTLVANVS